jgi:uncharacterized cupredoxin-like copper-binding protein
MTPMKMNRRTVFGASAATVLLTAVSITAVATAQRGSTGHSGGDATGMMRTRPAASSCQGPTVQAGRRVTVILADMGGATMMSSQRDGGWMMLRATPQSVKAGLVTLVAINRSLRDHELVVLPLPNGAPPGARSVSADGMVDETGSLGEASTTCGAGAGTGISPGAGSWVTLDLKPGRYELLCNLPHHYAGGMYTELDVT